MEGEVSMTLGYVLKCNYNLPYNASDFSMLQRRSRLKRSGSGFALSRTTSRREGKLQLCGLNRACIKMRPILPSRSSSPSCNPPVMPVCNFPSHLRVRASKRAVLPGGHAVSRKRKCAETEITNVTDRTIMKRVILRVVKKIIKKKNSDAR